MRCEAMPRQNKKKCPGLRQQQTTPSNIDQLARAVYKGDYDVVLSRPAPTSTKSPLLPLPAAHFSFSHANKATTTAHGS